MSLRTEVIILNCISREELTPIYKNGEIDNFETTWEQRVNMNNLEDDYGFLKMKFSSSDPESELSMTFIDYQLQYNKYYTREGMLYYNLLADYFEQRERYNFLTAYTGSHIKFFKEKVFNSEVLYIIVSGWKFFIDEYDFFNHLGIPMARNIFIKTDISSIRDIADAKCYYDVFSAELPKKSLNFFGGVVVYNKKAVSRMLEEGVNNVNYLDSAGVDDRERFITDGIPAWTLTTRSVFMKGVIVCYGIFPPKKFLDSGEEFCVETIFERFQQSADYRWQINDAMRQVLAKHCENLGLVKRINNYRTVDINKLLSI